MLPHQIITASAGSGKTWSLTVRYLRLLTMGAVPESIVALTFSRKAAGEFFNAILHRLAEAASDASMAAQLATDVGNPLLTMHVFRKHLVHLVDALHRLTLGTLDSFFIRIARSFPLELGLTGDFTILDTYQQGLEKDRVYSRVFRTHSRTHHLATRLPSGFPRGDMGQRRNQTSPESRSLHQNLSRILFDRSRGCCVGRCRSHSQGRALSDPN